MVPQPCEIIPLVTNFAPLFSKRVWAHAVGLLLGAILTPGKRTVTAALRIMGLADERHFINYHRMLSRARWSSLRLSRVLFILLVETFVPNGPLVLGGDDTLERRVGKRIHAKGTVTPSRCGAFQPQSFCQSQWAALVESHAAERDSLGRTRLGFTVLNRVSSI